VEGAYIETPARRPIVDHNKESNGFAAPLILRCRLIGVPTMSYNVRSSRFPVLSFGVLSENRRQLIRCALTRHRDDLAKLFALRTSERFKHARHVAKAIGVLRVATVATPSITDEIERWLPPRAFHALHATALRRSLNRLCAFLVASNGGQPSPSSGKPARSRSRRFLLRTRHSLNALAR
jgi:hypothetical protein